jgi:hypothetical protein
MHKGESCAYPYCTGVGIFRVYTEVELQAHGCILLIDWLVLGMEPRVSHKLSTTVPLSLIPTL